MEKINFITGNKFKNSSNYSLDEFGFSVIREPSVNEIIKFFVKIDLVDEFFKTKQTKPYILITHNGDRAVNESHIKYIDDMNLIKWYGQNINIVHPKVKSIPIGIANERWPHGNELIFNNVINSNIEKERLIYINFDVNTNKKERSHCLTEIEKNGLRMDKKRSFNDYLIELSKSYFVVSPNGNGIDCHKTWEALYLKTIPIVTKSINIDFYKNYPILIIEDWSKFNINDISVELYNNIWGNFDFKKININDFLKL